MPNEGKSTLASNLALAYAASGLRTLLIDGDCYAMSVTSAFGLNRPGLNEVLEGRAKLSNALVREAQSGLFVLAARDPSSAARETGDKALASLLRDLRDQFELIIVDCPAILPVDGGSFVERATHIAFVIAWDETERAAGRGGVRDARQPFFQAYRRGPEQGLATLVWGVRWWALPALRHRGAGPRGTPAPTPTPITALTLRAAFTRRAAP